MPPRKPLYILVGMFYNPWKDTLEPVRTAETDAMCESTPLAIPTPVSSLFPNEYDTKVISLV